MISAPWPIEVFETLPSTNTYILDRMRSGNWSKSRWILAKNQTAGRGTRGKVWQAKTGNLFISGGFLTPSTQASRLQASGLETSEPLVTGSRVTGSMVTGTSPPETQTPQMLAPHNFGYIAALAIRRTILHFAPRTNPQVKWPNDVRVDKAKISGILVETVQVETAQNALNTGIVIGMGVNICAAAAGVGQDTCCLADFLPTPPRQVDFAEKLVENFAQMREFMMPEPSQIAEAWNSAAESIGRTVSITSPTGTVCGINLGIDDTGALNIRTPSGKIEKIISGQTD